MTKEELLGKELSNLYAIAKQVKNYFDESDISFLTERTQKVLVGYVEFSCKNEAQASQALRNLGFNPGNTTDSIVQEITENLHEIATLKGQSKELKALGYAMSLNRLMGYHKANIENLGYLSDKI